MLSPEEELALCRQAIDGAYAYIVKAASVQAEEDPEEPWLGGNEIVGAMVCLTYAKDRRWEALQAYLAPEAPAGEGPSPGEPGYQEPLPLEGL
jgi:hypothetical protein